MTILQIVFTSYISLSGHISFYYNIKIKVYFFLKHFKPSKAGMSLAQRAEARIKRRDTGKVEEKDGIWRCRSTLHLNN